MFKSDDLVLLNTQHIISAVGLTKLSDIQL